MNQLIAEPAQPTLALKALMKRKTAMVDKHEEITLPIVLSCNYQSDITYHRQNSLIAVTLLSINLYAHR